MAADAALLALTLHNYAALPRKLKREPEARAEAIGKREPAPGKAASK